MAINRSALPLVVVGMVLLMVVMRFARQSSSPSPSLSSSPSSLLKAANHPLAAPTSPPTTTTTTASPAPRFQRREGSEVGVVAEKTELGGVVIVNANDLGQMSLEECRAACLARRGCNVWVRCDAGHCAGKCWLKHTDDPANPPVRASGDRVPWTSGSFLRAFLLPEEAAQFASAAPPPLDRIVLHTPHGDMSIFLKPEWSMGSVTYVRNVAAYGLCTQCELYRVEPGFLIQGIIKAMIAPNKELKEGPKLMERGEVGWAGGFAGPDFFVYLGAQPARHFGTSHTVWGVLDEASIAVAERIVQLPSSTPNGPNTMRFLNQRIQFDVVE